MWANTSWSRADDDSQYFAAHEVRLRMLALTFAQYPRTMTHHIDPGCLYLRSSPVSDGVKEGDWETKEAAPAAGSLPRSGSNDESGTG